MRTYQDLVEVGADETRRALFCRKAVDEFKSSREYSEAVAGEAYYNKHNLTIEKFQKFLYTVTGRQIPDLISANYKLKTTFFRRFVQQQVQYVLGNGMTLQKPENKEKLGKDFDFKLITIAKKAMTNGRAFGFWNVNHMEVFGYADTPTEPGFCPLYSEENSKLMAGIRFWQRKVGNDMMYMMTLYEPDGFTEYKQKENKEPEVVQTKRAYKINRISTEADGVIEETSENYTDLPIVCMYANDSKESELVGHREVIDCYDLVKSGFANNIDDLDGLFWIIENSGGMDDLDLARFIQRVKTTHTASVEGDDGTKATPHEANIPTEARKTMLEMLRSDLYEDFQSVDIKALSAAAKTTQEIKAAFQSMDNKCADFEYFIIDFVQKILDLAGIDDKPSFTWNRMINQTEQTNMILTAAEYLTEDMVIKKLPFLTPEEVDEVLKQKKEMAVSQFNQDDDEDDNKTGNEEDMEDDKADNDEV